VAHHSARRDRLDKELDRAWDALARGEPGRARKLAGRVLTRARRAEQRAGAQLLIAEAALAEDDDAAARRALAEIEAAPLTDADAVCAAGELYLELLDPAAAARCFRAALAFDSDLGDAHYGLGLACEAAGDRAGMCAAWLAARRCDLQAPHAPWHLPAAEFERIAEAAFAELPEAARRHLENVPILISDTPAAEVVAEGGDPRMLGLFSGVPFGDKSHVGGGDAHPDTVHLYQRNIEAACAGPEELEREIAITLWHETAHFFGLDDDDLDEIGLG
jgi:predicted Zn-dependent protease with MMP-like domain